MISQCIQQMAMKILKENPNIANNPNAQSMINVIQSGDEKEDIQSRPYKVPDGFVPTITKLPIFFESYVTCPQCGKTMTVKSQK